VLAAGAIGVGVGLTVAANAKAKKAADLGAGLDRSACAGTTPAANCGDLHDALKSQGSLSNAAVGTFITGGVLAAATAAAYVWMRSGHATTSVAIAPDAGKNHAGLSATLPW
jgi:hypothetical protein